MATHRATFPDYHDGRNSRYIGWVKVRVRPGTILNLEADDEAVFTVGAQTVSIRTPNPSPGSGSYIPGRGSIIYAGNGGEVIINFSAASEGGKGYVSISGMDEVIDSDWEQTFLEDSGWDIGIPPLINTDAAEGFETSNVTLDANPNKLEWPENAGTLTTESSAKWAWLRVGVPPEYAQIPEYFHVLAGWKENPNTSPRTCQISWNLSNPDESGTIVINQAAAVFDPEKTFYIDPTAMTFDRMGGSQGVTFFNADKHDGITSATSDADWVRAYRSGLVSCSINPTDEPRTATLTWTCADTATASVTITQTATETPDELTVTPSVISVDASSQTATLTVTANCDWTILSQSDWLSATATGDVVTVSISENTDSAARSSAVTFLSPTGNVLARVPVAQAAAGATDAPPALSVIPEVFATDWNGGRTPLTVNANCAWTATAPTWATLSATSGNGDTLLAVTIDTNESETEERSGEIIFSYADGALTQTVTVTQSAKPASTPQPELRVYPVRTSATADAGTATITVTANCAWQLADVPGWMTATASPATGTVNIEYTANESNSARTATLRFLVPETIDGETPSVDSGATWTMTQAVAPADIAPTETLSASMTPAGFPYGGGSATLTATFSGVDPNDVRLTVTGDWLVSGEPTITDTTKTWTLTAPDNTGGLWRPATLTVSVGELWQTINTAQVTGGVAMKLLPGTLFAGENRVQFFL